MICEIRRIENLNTKVNIYGLETLYGILLYSLLINHRLLSPHSNVMGQRQKEVSKESGQ